MPKLVGGTRENIQTDKLKPKAKERRGKGTVEGSWDRNGANTGGRQLPSAEFASGRECI